MRTRILLWSVTSALAGFLFGFDTVVISGAEQAIQKQYALGSWAHGAVVASALFGTVFGSLLGGWAADRFGRRATLIGVGVLYVISAIGCAAAWNVASFVLARLLGGVGIGISTVAAPLYIAEIAPPTHRGRLAGLFQFNIVFGIVVALLSNYLLSGVGGESWRWMLGVAVLPSAIYTVLCLAIPESPRWLLARRGDRVAGLRVLGLIRPEATPAELNSAADDILRAAQEQHRGGFWSRRLRRPIQLAFLIAFFNQLSGINAVLYFAPRIFEEAGMGQNAALLQSVGIGVTNLIFTFIGLWLIDRLGRRTLLFIGSVGYIVSLGLTAWAFQTGHSAIVPACLFAFIAAHAVGQGAVIWVFISEIFPTRHRAEGQALGSATHWAFAALLTLVFPRLVEQFSPAGVFLFFCGMMVFQLFWVWRAVPETRGVPLEELERQLTG